MTLEEQIIKITAQELRLKEEVVTLESKFKDDLGTDSLDELELIVEIEAQLKIELPEELHDRVHTVQDLVNEVRKIIK